MMAALGPSERNRPDLRAYHERARTGPCFVCGIVGRDPGFEGRHIIYEDEAAIASFNRWPTQYGYTLVAPKVHRDQVTGDFAVEEYLRLQRSVYQVTEALRREVGAELVYVLSLGSNEGNAHVHWHVVPGVPYEEQQFAALMWETAGVMEIPEREKADLAGRVGRRIGEIA